MRDIKTPYDFEVAFNSWLARGIDYTARRLGELPPGRALELLQGSHLETLERREDLNVRRAALNDRLDQSAGAAGLDPA